MGLKEDYIQLKIDQGVSQEACDDNINRCGFIDERQQDLNFFKDNLSKWERVFDALIEKGYTNNKYVTRAAQAIKTALSTRAELSTTSAKLAVSRADNEIFFPSGGRRRKTRKGRRSTRRRRTVARRR